MTGRWLATRALPPLLVLVVFLAGWEGIARAAEIPPYLLPPPSAIADALVTAREELISATALTAVAAGSGFLCSLLLGGLIAFIFSQSRWIQRSLYPYAIFLQTVPIIAVAPLIVIWVGTGLKSVVLVSLIISLFPVITNATTGLTRIDPALVDLFAMYDASRWQLLFKLRLPGSIPFFVAGAKVSSGLAVIGAIVGEFFAGSTERFGLGYVILVSSGQLRTAKLFAAVAASTILGLILFALVDGIGGWILARWSGRERET